MLLFSLVITLNAASSEEMRPGLEVEESGADKLSVNFQDIPVRQVLQQIADYNDFNLVVSDAVSGNLTLRVKEVPWPQLLDIILRMKGLEKRMDGSVLLVATAAEIAQFRQQKLEQEKVTAELQPLESEIIAMRFAKAADIAALLSDSAAMRMLSERGAISIDTRTNSLLIRDVAINIQAMKAIITALDVPVKQVQIEARIVSLNEVDLQELGVRWGFSSTNGSHSVGGSIENNLANLNLYGDSDSSLDDFLNVNLAATSVNASTIAFQVAKLGSDTLLDLELSALQRESRAEVISSPRLITTNKQPAYIEQWGLKFLI